MKSKFTFLLIINILISQNLFSQNIVINEVVAKNVLGYLDPLTNENPDWIELKNTGATSVNLSGYYLTNDETQLTKWTFPVGTTIPSNGFLLILADEKNTALHTNFKLNSSNQKIILSNSSLVEIDRIEYTNLQNDISYGKSSPTTNSLFSNPTPLANNDLSAVFNYSISQLTISKPSGLYSTPQVISIANSGLGTIHYTLDGSKPTSASLIYTTAITINSNTVLKAIIIESPTTFSIIENRSYVFDSPSDLAVILLTSDNYFYNFNNHEKIDGRVEFTFIETNGTTQINQYADFRPSGNTVQFFPQLSGKLEAEEIYGKKEFSHKVFPDKKINEFKSILLRNASQDFANTHLRDAYISQILGKDNLTNTPFEAYRPAALYVNAEYRGIINIREDNDNNYIEHNFCLKKGEYRRLNDPSLPFGTWQPNGSYVDFSSLDFNIAADRAAFNNLVNFQEHLSLKLLFSFAPPGEWGWTMWEDLVGNTGTQYHYNFHDFDPILGLAYDGANYTIINITPMPVTNLMETQIRDYEPYKKEAIHYICANLNHVYSRERINEVLDHMQAELLTEMPKHISAIAGLVASSSLSFSGSQLPFTSLSQWLSNMNDLRTNSINRIDDSLFIRIQQEYSLDEPIQITYESSNSEMGFVRVHGVKSNYQTFTGTYFKNIPIQLTAEAKPGYRFVNWEGDISSLSDSINPIFITNASLKANFEAIPTISVDLVINEVQAKNNLTIADENGDFNDWIEIYNPSSTAVDLAGYFISNSLSDSLKMEIPKTNASKTTVPAFGYLLLWADNELCEGENHLNFKLKETDQVILMYPDAITPVQSISFSLTNSDYSFGAQTDASPVYVIFSDPTPNYSNNLSNIDELGDNLNLSVFPNPTTGIIHISTLEIENNSPKWSVIDITGKLIFSGTGLEIDLSQEKSGLYFLQVENYPTQRIIKN